MSRWDQEAEKIMIEHFGKDTIIALSTVDNDMPFVRYVNAYYENGAFYIITYALSNKMKHIEKNPTVAIAGDWFTAQGKGVNLGYFGKKENVEIADKLKKAFAEWIILHIKRWEPESCYSELKTGLMQEKPFSILFGAGCARF